MCESRPPTLQLRIPALAGPELRSHPLHALAMLSHTSVHRAVRWQGAGLARTQMRWTFLPSAFLIAEKFIRSQTIVCSKMSGENNEAASAAVRVLLLNGQLNGTSWCLGTLPPQADD